ncbi:MAG TPA: FecR family protein [Polyangiales bacterium]|nr:FecR family protein [Polyangiales bacterium]
MAEWLQRARAESAGLSVVVAAEPAAALRRRIDVRLQRRRVTRNAGYAVAATGLMLAVWANLARSPGAAPVARYDAPPAAHAPAVSLRAAQASWRFGDGSLATALGADAALRVERDDREQTQLQLSAGGARFDVRPRAGRPFVVRAGAVEVRVLGTRFEVVRRADGSVGVAVEHGLVQVTAAGETVSLRAGEHGQYSAPLPAVASVVAPSAVRVSLPAAASPAVHTAAGDRKPPALAHVAGAQDPVAELLATADLARREGRPAAAVTALERVLRAHPRDPRAASAAFSLGRVLLETQPQPALAAAAFARAGELDPHGPLAEDALAREVEAWARAGSRARARVLAQRYLQRYPGSARTAFVRAHAGLE